MSSINKGFGRKGSRPRKAHSQGNIATAAGKSASVSQQQEMAAAPRFKIEHDLATSLWMTKPKPGLQPPWEFFANLCTTDAASMQRLAEYLHCSLYDLPPGDVEKDMTRTEIFEVRRMLDEVNGRKEYKESGFGIHGKRLTPLVEKTNDLLFNILDWFADSWQRTDDEILWRSKKVKKHVTIFVRQLDAYKAEHALAKVKWEKFEKKQELKYCPLDNVPSPEVEHAPQSEAGEDEEKNSSRPTSDTEFVATGNAEIEEQPSFIAEPEVGFDGEDELTDITESAIRPSIVAPSRRNISLSSTNFTGVDEYNPEDGRVFDTELFSRINLEDAGNGAPGFDNRGFHGERMFHNEWTSDAPFQVDDNDGFQSRLTQRDVSGGRPLSMRNESTARDYTRDVDQMEDSTGMETSEAFSMSDIHENNYRRDTDEQTATATKPQRGRKRKSMADNRSDCSSSAESVVCHLSPFTY